MFEDKWIVKITENELVYFCVFIKVQF